VTQRVTIRTLVLMLELLAAVVGFQCVTAARPAKADALWLAGNGLVAVPSPAEPGTATLEP
jgi:hypothetical protein